jgi:PHD/YefM family antitoxin component YafN of YafNO toxin-antitoxin module
MTIVPMRDLKDTVKIENLCAKENGPIFVTKNGYGRLVVMDIAYFESVMKQVYEAKVVNEGLSDLEEGRAQDGETVREEMKKKYGL